MRKLNEIDNWIEEGKSLSKKMDEWRKSYTCKHNCWEWKKWKFCIHLRKDRAKFFKKEIESQIDSLIKIGEK